MDDRGWVEYEVIRNIFWINTFFWDTKGIKESNKVWSDVKAFAKRHNCNKIQFTTRRDGKVWERRFKEMKVIQWKVEANI